VVAASLEQGVAAAQAGDRVEARRLFTEALEREDGNLQAWLWMAQVVDNAEDRVICYENVLTLEPDNAEAREALGQAAPSSVPEAVVEPEPAPAPPADPWERLEDEPRCPHCLAHTSPDQRRCPACRQRLWIRVRRKEKRSTTLWILIALQLLQTLLMGAVALGAIFLTNQLAAGLDVTPEAAMLLEAQYGLAPETLALVTGAWRNALYVAASLPFVFSALLLIGFYARWPVIFYLMLLQAVLGFLSSVANIFLAASASSALIPTVIGMLFSLGCLLFVLRLEDDFILEKRRVLLRLDRDVHDGPDFLRRGREYASRKMWGMSALHFRRAAAQLRVADAYLALTIACLELDAYDLAARALDEARAIAPQNPKVAEFTALLAERR
jgi:tetratricopeptide (TPR) repeat protein